MESKKFYLSEYMTNKFLTESEKINLSNEKSEFDVNPCSIIQKYIENPLLLNKKKFDIRCYALIACCKPLIILFHHGYLRLSANDFNLGKLINY